MLHFQPMHSFFINTTVVQDLFNKRSRPTVARIPAYNIKQVAESVWSLNYGRHETVESDLVFRQGKEILLF
jgi:hypothetical protein